jgi:glycosyl transferase family 87
VDARELGRATTTASDLLQLHPARDATAADEPATGSTTAAPRDSFAAASGHSTACGAAAADRAARAATPAIIGDAGTRLAARVTALTAPLFVLACAVPDGGLFRAERYRDVHLYGIYADGFFRGNLPYRDVFVEYPPGAFVVFMPPAVLPGGAYNAAFKTSMALCGVAALFAVVLALVTLGASRRRLYAAAVLFALSPIAVGPISLNTYDLFPAALTVGALAAVLRRRELLGFGLLGLAVTAKLYPLVLIPLAAVYVWPLAGRDRTLRALGVCAAVTLIVVLPFAILSPGGLWDSFHSQSARGLQIESLGASVLLAADQLGVYAATVVHGATGAATRDLAGSLPDALATVTTLLQAVAVAVVWWLFARGSRRPEQLVLASAAAVTGFLVFNRFVSPQYVVWLIPLVLLVPGATGIAAIALVTAALLLAQVWFFHYSHLFQLEGISWLVVTRDALLLALYLLLVVRLKTSTPSSEKTSRQFGLRRSRESASAVASGSQRSA